MRTVHTHTLAWEEFSKLFSPVVARIHTDSPRTRRSIWGRKNMAFGNSSQMDGSALRRIIAEHLKACPLCGALNSIENHECTVCAWHGGFQHDPIIVEYKFHELIYSCPELFECLEPVQPPKAPWWKRIRLTWNRFRKRIDFRI